MTRDEIVRSAEAGVADAATEHVAKYLDRFITGDRLLEPPAPEAIEDDVAALGITTYRATLRATLGATIDALRERGWQPPAPSTRSADDSEGVPLGDLDTRSGGPTLRWCGVWAAEQVYTPGAVVTDKDCLWVCGRRLQGVRPGRGAASGWRLALKSPDRRVK
jgi:hypothetical protein